MEIYQISVFLENQAGKLAEITQILYENGIDLLTIKTLMGHKSLESTTLYVHLAVCSTSSIRSPFDLMGDAHDD